MRRGNATTFWTRGTREAKWEVMAQHEERPRNSYERWRRWQMGGSGGGQATQHPAGQEAQEAIVQGEAMAQ